MQPFSGHDTAKSRVSARFVAAAAVVVLGAVAYSNSFYPQFVFDDVFEIAEVPVIRDLGAFLLRSDGYRYQPNRFLAYLSFAINYRIGGLDPTGYHLFNTAIHLTNALLVLGFVRLTFRTPKLARSSLEPCSAAVALIAAALFVAHPLQTQAVTYVVQRIASLATMFYLLAVVLYVRWRLEGEQTQRTSARAAIGFIPVLLAIVAAMKTKEIAFTLPLVISMYEVSFFGPVTRRKIAFLLPVAATLAVIPLSILDVERPIGELLAHASSATRVQTTLPRLDYLATQTTVVVKYVQLLLLPVGQSLEHDHPIARSFLEHRVLVAAVVLASFAALSAALYYATRSPASGAFPLDPGWRLVAFGIAWFFVTLSVESSVIPIVDVLFEHRAYLPSVGFFVAVTTSAALGAQGLAPARARRVLLVAGGAVAIVLAWATVQRNAVWRDPVSLWADVVEKSPRLPRARLNLGEALVARGEVDAAIPHYVAALRLNPTYAKARNNLGVAYFKKGLLDESIAELRTAVALDPAYAEAHHNLGIAYGKKGWREEAWREMSLGARLKSRKRLDR